MSRTRIVELEEFGSTIGCGSLMRSGCDVEAGSAAGQVDHGAEAVHVPEAAGAGSDVLRSV